MKIPLQQTENQVAECTKTVPLICESIRKAERRAGDSSESLDKLPENYYNESRCCIGVAICICTCAGALLVRMPDRSGKVQICRSIAYRISAAAVHGFEAAVGRTMHSLQCFSGYRASTKEASTKFYERGKKECISRKAEQFSPLFSQQQWRPVL